MDRFLIDFSYNWHDIAIIFPYWIETKGNTRWLVEQVDLVLRQGFTWIFCVHMYVVTFFKKYFMQADYILWIIFYFSILIHHEKWILVEEFHLHNIKVDQKGTISSIKCCHILCRVVVKRASKHGLITQVSRLQGSWSCPSCQLNNGLLIRVTCAQILYACVPSLRMKLRILIKI